MYRATVGLSAEPNFVPKFAREAQFELKNNCWSSALSKQTTLLT